MSTRTRRQRLKPYRLPKLQRYPTRTLTLYLNMELHLRNENVLMVLLILFLQLIFKLLMIHLLLFRWWKLLAGLAYMELFNWNVLLVTKTLRFQRQSISSIFSCASGVSYGWDKVKNHNYTNGFNKGCY